MQETPFRSITKILSDHIPVNLLSFLPRKWEKIGSVVTIKVSDELKEFQEIIGKVYANELGCKTTLNDTGGIFGVYRTPVVEVIFGSSATETIHVENGIRFKVDPQKVMFSSGNMAERKRMATIAHADETVVDLFAGIGYFTLPIAVYSRPKKIVACEINPIAFDFLESNVVLNHVSNIVVPLLGDNRTTAPKNSADRVILGFLQDPQDFLPVALECLKNEVGILHYHELVPVELIPQQPFSHIKEAASCFNRGVELLGVHEVKSYAPQIHHVVLDVRISK